MTRTRLSDWEQLVLQLACSYCGAKEGDWCLRRSYETGEVSGYASWLHSDRDKVLRAARQEGWISREHYIAHTIANIDDPNENPRYREHSKQWLAGLPAQHKMRSDCPICGRDPEAA